MKVEFQGTPQRLRSDRCGQSIGSLAKLREDNMHDTARGMTRSQDSMIDDQLSQSPPACQSITYLHAYMYSYKL